MKRVWLALTFSFLAANVWAVPAPEREPSAEMKMSLQRVHETIAQDGHAQLIKQYQRV
ncbi:MULTISPECIES: hypothetical protein [Pseudomonas]|jgi:hypothetical protein|uniref:Uncharacterized protein n=1 Tax=Pseudomonas folii TaxID=2762593 RepID=A0ABR7B6S4_9PSED|nr:MULTISPECIES: hypothetical protein [Pseudomonas]MBC3952875.1 hypothetical protein [Pseudomonas folii]